MQHSPKTISLFFYLFFFLHICNMANGHSTFTLSEFAALIGKDRATVWRWAKKSPERFKMYDAQLKDNKVVKTNPKRSSISQV